MRSKSSSFGIAIGISLLTICGAARAEDDHVPVSIGIAYPLATNANRPEVTSNVDIGAVYNVVGHVEGAQVGGVAAITLDGVTGAQVAPVNVVGGPVTGAQVGLVNVGGRVRGVQLGLVNVADEVDGAAIGLVSVSKDSVHPVAWASNLQYMNAGFKFTNKYFFTMIGVHYGTHEADLDAFGATFAAGGRVPLPRKFDVELQGSLTELVSTHAKIADAQKNTWIAPQVAAGYSFAPHFRVFAGGGVRLPISVQIGREVTRPEVLAGLQW